MAICIEIEMDDSGNLTVTECPPKEEMAEGPEAAEGGQQFTDVKSALMAAAQMLTAGQTQDPGAAQEEADQGMAQGFSSVRGSMANG